MNKLHIYDSLSSGIKPFEPIEKGKVGMYVCGPTVYSKSHLCNKGDIPNLLRVSDCIDGSP